MARESYHADAWETQPWQWNRDQWDLWNHGQDRDQSEPQWGRQSEAVSTVDAETPGAAQTAVAAEQIPRAEAIASETAIPRGASAVPLAEGKSAPATAVAAEQIPRAEGIASETVIPGRASAVPVA